MTGRAWVVMMCAAMLVGCAADGQSVSAPARDELTGVPGLEVRWWIVDNRDHAVGRALRTLEADPTPIDAATLARLRAAGLRVVAVGADDLAALHAGWRTVGAAQEHHFRMTPGWSEIVRGPRLRAGSQVDPGTGAIELGAGALRLVARCWGEPGENLRDAATIRFELVPQLASTPPADTLGLANSESVTFGSLRAAWSSSEPTAVLIVGEDPAADWGALPEPVEPAPVEVEQVEPEQSEGAAPEDTGSVLPAWAEGPGMAGPSPRRVPTVGEVMLATRPSRERPGGLRVVVVVIVRPAERWSPLAR